MEVGEGVAVMGSGSRLPRREEWAAVLCCRWSAARPGAARVRASERAPTGVQHKSWYTLSFDSRTTNLQKGNDHNNEHYELQRTHLSGKQLTLQERYELQRTKRAAH